MVLILLCPRRMSLTEIRWHFFSILFLLSLQVHHKLITHFCHTVTVSQLVRKSELILSSPSFHLLHLRLRPLPLHHTFLPICHQQQQQQHRIHYPWPPPFHRLQIASVAWVSRKTFGKIKHYASTIFSDLWALIRRLSFSLSLVPNFSSIFPRKVSDNSSTQRQSSVQPAAAAHYCVF